MRWINSPENIDKYTGFVYRITHKQSGKYYIGKKNFWFKKTRKPLKGRSNKRHYVVESDWKEYWGSSNKFIEYVEEQGKSNFKREILVLCTSNFDLSYQELLQQLKHNVLFDDNSFNEIINVRLRKRKVS